MEDIRKANARITWENIVTVLEIDDEPKEKNRWVIINIKSNSLINGKLSKIEKNDG